VVGDRILVQDGRKQSPQGTREDRIGRSKSLTRSVERTERKGQQRKSSWVREEEEGIERTLLAVKDPPESSDEDDQSGTKGKRREGEEAV